MKITVEKFISNFNKTKNNAELRFNISYNNNEGSNVLVETFTDVKECSRLADEVEDFNVVVDPTLVMVFITVKTK